MPSMNTRTSPSHPAQRMSVPVSTPYTMWPCPATSAITEFLPGVFGVGG